MWSMKDHGKNQRKVREVNSTGRSDSCMISSAVTHRLTEMQAAIGRIQLTRLSKMVDARRRNAAIYKEVLGDLAAIEIPEPPWEFHHAYYKFYLLIRADRLRPGWSRDRLREEIVARGVPCFSGACPEIYLEQSFQEAGFAPSSPRPVSRDRGSRTLMLLVHPTLTENDVGQMATTVRSVIKAATA